MNSLVSSNRLLIESLNFSPCDTILSHFSHVQFFAILWTVARQAPLPIGSSRQEHWSGLPSPPPNITPYHLQMKSEENFTSSFPIWMFIHFPYLIAIAGIFSTMLNKRDKSGNSCPWCWRKSFQPFTTECDVSSGLVT